MKKKKHKFTAYQYDALGRILAVLTPGSSSVMSAGTVATNAETQVGTVTASTRYNAYGEVGERVTAVSANPSAAPPQRLFLVWTFKFLVVRCLFSGHLPHQPEHFSRLCVAVGG